jgi:spermidine/putrescine transport system substrate-binding protein
VKGERKKMLLKKITRVTLATTVCVMLTGCGDSYSTVEQVMDAKEEFGCNVINVYNAGEYIGEDVISNFETMYNARVNYDTFESNEIMYTKLLGGSSYDVIIPSDYMIERMISEDMLQPLNKSQITNESDLNPAVVEMRETFDPDGVYSVPYFWGTVGIVYNKQVVDEETVKKEGWEILRDTNYKGNIYFYDSQRDGFMVAFKALGYSMNTDDPDEIQEAYEWLREMNNTMEPSYVTDEVIDGMVNYEKGIAVMYSGDAAYVLSENMDMAWYEPDQGTNKWVDAMVIPKNASCSGLANEFINYAISYDVQLANSEYVGYTPVRKDVEEYLSGEDGDYFEIDAYSPRTDGVNDETFHYNEKLTKQLSDLWNKVKIQ